MNIQHINHIWNNNLGRGRYPIFIISNNNTIYVRIDSQLDLGAKETLTIRYGLQNMHKIDERLKITYTHEVNNIYYYEFPTCKYIQN